MVSLTGVLVVDAEGETEDGWLRLAVSLAVVLAVDVGGEADIGLVGSWVGSGVDCSILTGGARLMSCSLCSLLAFFFSLEKRLPLTRSASSMIPVNSSLMLRPLIKLNKVC
jgi:hypothetical protein